jgi:TPR repeat protein
MLLRSLALLILLIGVEVPAQAQPSIPPVKLALVIGNSDYSVLNPLANPAVETARVAAALQNAGFRVTHLTNRNAAQMRAALETFSQNARALPPDSVALIYFSGHGFSYRNTNYIIPLGTAPLSAGNIQTEAISLVELTAYVPASPQIASVVVVDACRDVPEGLRDVRLTYTFARSNPPANGLLAFSTAEGSTAADGSSGAGSPFANAFIEMLNRFPGSEIELLFRRVRRAVATATENGQIPVEYNGLIRAASLNGNAQSTRDRRTVFALDLIDNGDAAEGLALARRSALEGDVSAMRIVSDAYRLGNGVAVDRAVALDWARRAAEAGNDDDRAYWSDMVLTSERQPTERGGEARRMLDRLLAAGNRDAIWFTARQAMMRGGAIRARTMNADWARAAQLWERAALLGSGSAATNLGAQYQMGAGVPHDLAQAERWYRLAADMGLPRGMTRLAGILSSYGTRVRTPAQDEEAVRLYRRAIAIGDPEAMFRLSWLAYLGIGMPRDREAAIALIGRAIETSGLRPNSGVPDNARLILEAMRSGQAIVEPMLDSTIQ